MSTNITEILSIPKVLYNSNLEEVNSEIVNKSNILGFYFANNSPVAFGFTKMLKECYIKWIDSTSNINNVNFQLIYVPLEKNNEEFKESLKTINFLAIPKLDNEETIKYLTKKYNISNQNLPSLIIVNKYGDIIDNKGVECINDHFDLAMNKWAIVASKDYKKLIKEN